MQQYRLFFRFGFLSILLTLTLAACSQKEQEIESSALYKQAESLEREKHYDEALELYNSTLAADTLNGFNTEALEALCRKGRIEYLTGRYQAAFQTWWSIEAHADEGKLDDSMRRAAGFDTARMYAELGRYSKAVSVAVSLGYADGWQRYERGVWLLRAGRVREAAQLFQALSESTDLCVSLSALSGLLDCSIISPTSTPSRPEHFASSIASMSRKVLKMSGDAELKIRALRIAARSFLQLESQRRNASYLFFKARGIAMQHGLLRLEQILQFESNAVIVRKPEVYRIAIDYFSRNGMYYAKADALCKLGACKELTPSERITALRSALTTCQYYGIPATSTGYLAIMRDATRQLDDLLIASGRFVELFDVSGQKDALETRSRMQAAISEFRLPAGHGALQNEIISVTTDIAGLLQRKIDMNEQGEGFRYAALIDKSITEKQGRLIELIAEVSKIDSHVASNLQSEPLTLNTLRQRLQPDEALVRFFAGDSSTTAIMVSNREMQIERSKVSESELKSGFSQLLRRYSEAGPGSFAGLLADPERIRLTDSLLHTMSVTLASYRHLIFVSEHPEPVHLLGRGELLGRGRKVSWLVSANEFTVPAQSSAGQDEGAGIDFFDADDVGKAQLYKLFHPRDRVFLSWEPLGEHEITALKTTLAQAPISARSAAGFLKQLGADGAEQASQGWLQLGAYGVE